MNQLDELIDRCNRMSYWLGFTWSALNTLVMDEKVPEYQKENIRILLNTLTDGIEDIFYKQQKTECEHQWIAISPEITVQSGEITAVAPQTKIKCSKCDKDYK